MKKLLSYSIYLIVFVALNFFVQKSFAMSKSPEVPRLDLTKLKLYLPYVPPLNLNSIKYKEKETEKPLDMFVEACKSCDLQKLENCLEKYSGDLSFLKDPTAFASFFSVVEGEIFRDLAKKDNSKIDFVNEFLSKKNEFAIKFLMSTIETNKKNNEIFRIAFFSLCFSKCLAMLKVLVKSENVIKFLNQEIINFALKIMYEAKWKEGINLLHENIRGRTILRNNMLKKMNII